MNTLGATVVVLPYLITKLGWIAAPVLLVTACMMSYGNGLMYNSVIAAFEKGGDTLIKVILIST